MIFLATLTSLLFLSYNINNKALSLYYKLPVGVTSFVCGILAVAFFSFVFLFMSEAMESIGIEAQLDRMYPESNMTTK